MYLKNAITGIRFWIVLFFVLRLFGITNPPLETAHHWRQTTVTMPARNFLETNNNILYPRVDFAGEKTGITGMEFPALNYLIYLLSLVFGYAHWYGRLINLIVSSIGLWFFYKLVKKYFNQSLAFNATFILLFSIWFTYSRKIMPDTFSMSLVIIGIYYGSNYFDTKSSIKNISGYFIFTLLGVLSKLPSAYLLIVFAPFIFDTEKNRKAKIIFILTTGIVISIVSVYYFYWVPYLTQHYQFEHFFMGKGILQGMREVFGDVYNGFEKFYLDTLQIAGFILFVAGLGLAMKNKSHRIILVFSLSFGAFVVIIFKAGLTFTHHSYYMVPFAPVMALLAANTLEYLTQPKLKLALLLLILIESLGNKMSDFYIKEENLALVRLETELDKLGERKDLILINSGEVPTPMYFAHRKGWIAKNVKVADDAWIQDLKSKGLKHIVILKRVFAKEISLNYRKVLENKDFDIYEP